MNKAGLCTDIKIKLPDNVTYIINKLEGEGFEAFAVGGCIRDSILGRIPDDWDITTSASPNQVKAVFSKTIDTGIQHGTVTVMIGKEGFEVTTYRIDGEYEDSRHPKEVLFTSNLTEDLKRRDFTINAMAYNDTQGLVDKFHGAEDLENKIIRCVGNAAERFEEDALRMLRAVRFAAQLGFEIEEETKTAIQSLVPALSRISAERIQTELVKLLVSKHPEAIRTAYELGITNIILPEFDEMMRTEQNHPHHRYSVGEHTLHALEFVEADKILRLSMLFHDVAKPLTKTTDEDGKDHFYGHAEEGADLTKVVLRRLKFDNDTIEKVTSLVRWHDYRMNATPEGVRRAIHKAGEDIFPYLFPIKRADILSQSEFQRQEKQQFVEDIEKIYHEIKEKEQCVSLKTMKITGNDLIALGMKPGKEIGEMLAYLLETVLDEPSKNKKEELIRLAKEYMQ